MQRSAPETPHHSDPVPLKEIEPIGKKSVHQSANGAGNSVARWGEIPAEDATNTPFVKILKEHYTIEEAVTAHCPGAYACA